MLGIKRRASIAMIVVLALWAGYILHGLTNRSTPLTYGAIPWKLQYGPLYPGDYVPIIVYRCNNTNKTLKYSTTHSIGDANNRERDIVLADVSVTLPATINGKPCGENISHITQLPLNLPPGRYFVYGIATVKSGFNSFDIKWQSDTFEVIAKPHN